MQFLPVIRYFFVFSFSGLSVIVSLDNGNIQSLFYVSASMCCHVVRHAGPNALFLLDAEIENA